MLEQMGKAAKKASYQLAALSTSQKNRALMTIADLLEAQHDAILAANEQDLAQARANGMSEALLDRLQLTPARLKAIADDVRQVCRLNDPVGEIIDGRILDNGLKLERRRVPLGVVGVIYEARPNVTVDVASLCLKTGNAVILRGGKEPNYSAEHVQAVKAGLEKAGLPTQVMIDFSHANSSKQFKNQMLVAEDVAGQLRTGSKAVFGVMVESHLVEGRQDLVDGCELTFGQSITDACLSWSDTETLLAMLAEAAQVRLDKQKA